jgi:hypothetical protein
MAELLGVILGGVLAVGGGAITQWQLHTWKTKEERRARRVAKYEELIAAIYEYDHWLGTLRNINVFGRELSETASPFAKMYAIVTLHFPEFTDHVKELDRLGDNYQLWIFQKGKQRLNNEIQKLNDGFDEVYKPYAKARHELLVELGKLAQECFAERQPTRGSVAARLIARFSRIEAT